MFTPIAELDNRRTTWMHMLRAIWVYFVPRAKQRENAKKLEFSFFMAMAFFPETISSLNSSPLFSAIITLYTLLLLYLPSLFRDLLFSPVLLSASALLFSLLRLGAAQRIYRDAADKQPILPSPGSVQNSDSGQEFIEWDVRAPLEAILEDEEEEGGGEVQRYASLLLHYPDSDSGSSSEGEFPVGRGWDYPSTERNCCWWDEEEERDELIEISLDGKTGFSEPEEDNLIEIDLFPGK
ncbi:unnamed protein product [Cuscuta campestris]|uniref:Uncharacterized protein n=1 Tax=Cuscuta campestris TaxID=132261 RepID=A0A484LZX1_9ASTE|nr:unnamed protein product [Cuscuta campestris]